jgi:hypothetical protein
MLGHGAACPAQPASAATVGAQAGAHPCTGRCWVGGRRCCACCWRSARGRRAPTAPTTRRSTWRRSARRCTTLALAGNTGVWLRRGSQLGGRGRMLLVLEVAPASRVGAADSGLTARADMLRSPLRLHWLPGPLLCPCRAVQWLTCALHSSMQGMGRGQTTIGRLTRGLLLAQGPATWRRCARWWRRWAGRRGARGTSAA